MDPENGADILGPKKLNYQFLVLVRQKKYPQALTIGKKILQTDPNNPSVKKFCDFILSHNKQLQKMVKQQQQYQQVDQDDEEAEQQQQEQGEQNENKQESSDEDSQKSGEQQQDQEEQEQEPKEQKQKQKEKPKVQLRTCTLNQIPHICTRDHN